MQFIPDAQPLVPETIERAEESMLPSVLLAPKEGYDPRNLSLDQKRVLAALLESPTQEAGFESIEPGHMLKWRGRHVRWLRSDPNYAEAVARIGDGMLAEAKAKLSSLVTKAADTFEEALEKDKVIDAHCPCGCDHDFTIVISDLAFRTRVAEKVLKPNLLAPKAKVEVSGEVKHRDMSLEDKVALAQVQRGMSVPPDVLAGLRLRGLLPPGFGDQGQSEPAREATEASYRILSPGSPAETD